MTNNENPFWTYSYALHESDGVGPACIELQDRHGLDVNLLLYCCWIGASGRSALDAADLEKASGTVQQWQRQVSTPIRDIRRILKTDSLGVPVELSQAFRKELMAVELASERVAQDALLAIASPSQGIEMGRRGNIVRENLRAYFNLAGVVPDDRDEKALDTIAASALAPIKA